MDQLICASLPTPTNCIIGMKWYVCSRHVYICDKKVTETDDDVVQIRLKKSITLLIYLPDCTVMFNLINTQKYSEKESYVSKTKKQKKKKKRKASLLH